MTFSCEMIISLKLSSYEIFHEDRSDYIIEIHNYTELCIHDFHQPIIAASLR